MSPKTKITLYYGPVSWFESLVPEAENEGLLEAVSARDEQKNLVRVVHTTEDADPPKPAEVERPEKLVARSGDYASLLEHVISNFPGIVQSLKPLELHLHNPPEQIRAHLERIYNDSLEIQEYAYPLITSDTLRAFRDKFSEHLVGQEDVRDSMLAALYPLTRARHGKPIVVMFYGPSGTGKTETAHFVNDLLGGNLMRKQFSMFQNENFASYLFGGKHSEASFAHDLLDRESGVILIDEFDKAASVFHSAFYQFFDGGIFEDKNYWVDVGRSLIICTSNYDSEDEIKKALGDALFSRFDALIQFEQLTEDEVSAVAARLVKRQYSRLDADEKEYLDEEFLRSRAQLLATNSDNIRKLGKGIEEMISILLVRQLLKDKEGTSGDVAETGTVE